MTIFVSIASFCDPHLEFTLDGLFGKSSNPSQVIVGLVDQSFEDNKKWLTEKPYWQNIRYVRINPIEARGVCWARSLVFSLFTDETYFFQIDSHTHFDINWDQSLINYLVELQARSKKPIISTYPPPFEFNEQGFPTLTSQPTKEMIYALRCNPDKQLTPLSAILGFKVEYVAGLDFIEGYHIGAGFIFTLGKFVHEIPYDPYLYFHGEEQSLALRAYTRGWSIYHPLHESIPIFHLYKKNGDDYQTHHWHAKYEEQRLLKWHELNKISEARLLKLVTGKMTNQFGLGDIRTLESFCSFSGIPYFSTYAENHSA